MTAREVYIVKLEHGLNIEDHYPEGGLGEAVLDALANVNNRYHNIAVTHLPRSGPGDKLLHMFGGIDYSLARVSEAVVRLEKLKT